MAIESGEQGKLFWEKSASTSLLDLRQPLAMWKYQAQVRIQHWTSVLHRQMLIPCQYYEAAVKVASEVHVYVLHAGEDYPCHLISLGAMDSGCSEKQLFAEKEGQF